MNNDNNKTTTAFGEFLHKVELTNYDTNTTATGLKTIQQSTRNELRKEGVKALKEDLIKLYGDEFDIVETKEGLIIVAENEPGDFTFSWELKNTIKSLDFDPFIEASNYEDATMSKELKKQRLAEEKKIKAANLELKRAAKLAELAARQKIKGDAEEN